MKVLSPAKINTFLHVHQQRADGYHELLTHFQLIGLYDELIFKIIDSAEIIIDNPAIDLMPEQDLCYQAARVLQRLSGCKKGVVIKVLKRIPAGGGLGGGSSNAATVLVVLNRLWRLNFTQDQLLRIGLSLGSDVPVFIYGLSTLATGRGEIFHQDENNNLLQNKMVILIKPTVSLSTAKIFHSQLLTKRPGTGKIRHLDTKRLIRSGENDFERVVFPLSPEVSQCVKLLATIGVTLHLTGTGACLYTVLDEAGKADKIIDALGRDCRYWLVNTLTTSPLKAIK